MLKKLAGAFRRRRVDSGPHVPSAPMDRPLTPDEDAALRWILHVEDMPGVEELRSQAPHVRVVYGGVTDLDLVVDAGTRSDVRDGHLPLTALVVGDNEEPVGHIDVWIKDGWLASLEYSWFTDQMPAAYATAERLRLWDVTDLVSEAARVTLSDPE